MACFQLVDGQFAPVEDPIKGDGDGDYYAELYKAGYLKQLSSGISETTEAEFTLYQHQTPGPGKPAYYIDICGFLGQLAAVVAEDFGGLVRTLNELRGLIALVALDQQTDIRAEAILGREARQKTARS